MKDEPSELIRDIVENIIFEAKIDGSGISWDTIIASIDKDKVDRGIRYGLDYGITGIAYFLLLYYKTHKDPRLIEIIDLALYKIFNYSKKSDAFIGFYNGRGGVIYTLTEAYRILGNRNYLERARELGNLNSQNTYTYSLESGISGLLLGILHLYGELKDPLLLDKVENLVNAIIQGVKVTKTGIYWDELPISMKPITGFLHGNSGIVFVLRESAVLFSDSHLFDKLIREAIAYEDSTFSEVDGNWPDYINEDGFLYNFKISSTLPYVKKKYKECDFPSSNSDWWSIGGPGMLLIRKESLFKNKMYEKSYKKIISSLKSSQINPDSYFCLYRGFGGVWLSLLHLEHKADINTIAEGIKAQKRKHGEILSSYPGNRHFLDISLFRGEAGIGYLLLLLNNSELYIDNSVLFPKVSQLKLVSRNKIPAMEIDKIIMEGNCFLQWNGHNPDKNKSYYDQIEQKINLVSSCKLIELNNLISIEKFKLINRNWNHRYEGMNMFYINQLKTIKPEFLKISNNVKLIKNSKRLILFRALGSVKVLTTDLLTFSVLELCDKESKVKVSLVLNILKNKNNKLYKEDKIKESIGNSIKNGFLVFD